MHQVGMKENRKDAGKPCLRRTLISGRGGYIKGLSSDLAAVAGIGEEAGA